MKYSIFLINFALISLCSESQICNSFTLSGQIGKLNGKVYLSTGFIGNSYYGACFRQLEAMAVNGKFEFKGSIGFPIGVRLAAADSIHSYYSGMIFLDSTNQLVDIDMDLNKIAPAVKNSETNYEYLNVYLPLNKKTDDLQMQYEKQYKDISVKYNRDIPDSILDMLQTHSQVIQKERDSILLVYAQSHPDSYVAMWQLIERVTVFGYKASYETTFHSLSSHMQNSFSGIELKRNINISKLVGIGRTFPDISLLRLNGHQENLNRMFKKITFLDFWFSQCGPCIRQFPELVKIFNKFKDSSFQMISVATDKAEMKNSLDDAIFSNHLDWPQYWDIDGKISRSVYINSFPTNFLIDANGKILAKNSKPGDLEIFLENYFKN